MRLIDADALMAHRRRVYVADPHRFIEDTAVLWDDVMKSPTVSTQNEPSEPSKEGINEMTKAEAYALAEMIHFNLFDNIRKDEDIDSMRWLKSVLSAYEKLCAISGYVGITEK